ncbi:MAG: polysaccharide biosynthesis transport protein [Chthoniobacter sp.]|jgi:capsular exopolysaccharide synthesis family protein|nr:polysaccharide biosynthesis transport protein [Chthoniobacter sp.]
MELTPPAPARSFSLPTDVRSVMHALLGKVWLIVLINVLALGGGILFIARSEKIFSATTTVEVEAEQQRIIKSDGRRADDRGEEALKTIEQNLDSSALLLRLARNPQLVSDASFLREVQSAASEARLEQILSGKMTVRVRPGTRLIDITAEDPSPAVAQKLSRLLVEEFIRSSSESRSQVSQTAQEFLRQEAERLQAALAKSEEALQQYKQQVRAVSLEEKQNIIVERLRDLNAKVTAAKTERLTREADQAQLQKLRGEPPPRLLLLPSVANAPEVVDLQRKVSAREADIATLRLRYKSLHPKMIEATSSLAELKHSLDEAIRNAAGLVGSGLEAARATEAKLEDALRSQESLALELSETAIPYNTLAREVEANRALYASLLARLKESDVAQSVSPYAVRMVAPAVLPDRPVKPNKSLILLLSVCGGLALSGTLVLGLHALDNSVRTIDQAERVFSLPALGAIPQQRKMTLRHTPQLLISRPQSAVAEAFHELRTTLLLVANKAAAPKVVLFASAIPGEGKTFCTINYAVALAQQGFRTLLIDADLRLPNVARAFFGSEQTSGLGDVLGGRCGVAEVTYSTDIENLFVLPAGPSLEHPAEVVGNADLAALLETARSRFDRVVIDTAPVLAVSETVFFAPHVEAICLVVRAGRTPIGAVARALEKLRLSGARVAGLVLNGLPTKGGYYYHYHAPGYGGDEVYGASAAAKG